MRACRPSCAAGRHGTNEYMQVYVGEVRPSQVYMLFMYRPLVTISYGQSMYRSGYELQRDSMNEPLVARLQ